MENTFAITITLKLKEKNLSYGKFVLGNDKIEATDIFCMLQGKTELTNACSIQMELIENVTNLPVPLGTIFCNLEELKENVALISKEVFRIAQLEEGTIIPLY